MRITEVTVLTEFRVALQFDDGASGLVDLSDLAGRGVFVAWMQAGFFEQATISDVGALHWPGGLDLCPDSLYLRMLDKSASEVFPILHNSLAHA